MHYSLLFYLYISYVAIFTLFVLNLNIGTMSFGKIPDSILMFMEISRLDEIDNLQIKSG